MGGIVSGVESQQAMADKTLKEHGDWFLNQGYTLNLVIRCNPDALADYKVYNNARFSCMLPTISPVTTQRNNDIYEHVARMKLKAQSQSKQGGQTGSSNYTSDPRTPGSRNIKT